MVVSKAHHLKYKNQRFKRLPKLVGPLLETSIFTSSFQVVKEPMPFAYYELPYLDWHYRQANVQVENGNHTVGIQGGTVEKNSSSTIGAPAGIVYTQYFRVFFFTHMYECFFTHIFQFYYFY